MGMESRGMLTEDLCSHRWTRKFLLEGQRRSGVTCALIHSVIVCSDQCSGFLTSRLVLAFFKTSCVLVTETTTKQFPKAEVTSGVHICLGCVCSGACLSGHSAWGLLLPSTPHISSSASMITDGTGGSGMSRQSPPPPSLSGHCPFTAQVGSLEGPPVSCPIPWLRAPTLAEDELFHALLLLVGGLQALRCTLKETLLFG